MIRKIVVLFFLCSAAVYAQERLSLKEALEHMIAYLGERIPSGSRIAVVSIHSEYPRLSEQLFDEITTRLVNSTYKYRILDRDHQGLKSLEQEMHLQLSGMVSDQTAVSIGKRLGAQTILTGTISQTGNDFTLYIKAIAVETGEIQGAQTAIIRDSALRPYTRHDTVAKPKPRESASYFPDSEAWKHKWFYLGGRIGFSSRTYYLNGGLKPEPGHIAFEGAAQMSLQMMNNLALQSEVVFSGDTVTVESANISVESFSLMVPVLAKLTFRPAFFYFTFFGGAYISFPLGQMNVTSGESSQSYDFKNPIGILGGTNIGVKMDYGVLFADLRFGKDMGYVKANNADQYSRSFVSLSLGYEWGLINRY
jgi:hypothetical protein